MAIMGKRFKSKIIYLLIPLIIFLAGYRIISLWNRFLPDFDVFYYAAQETLYYHNPYQSQKLFTAFNYPVTTILLYLPLLLFPYTQAQNIFLIITMLFIPLIILLSLHILKKYRLTYFLFFYFLSLLFFPINFTLGMGQSNIIGLFFIMMSYYFLSQSKNIISGIFLGLGIIIKPILIFLLLFFVLRKKWCILLFGIFIYAYVFLISGIIFGFDLHIYYFTHVIPDLFQLSGREVYYNQGLTGFISRLTDSLALRRIIPALISTIIVTSITYQYWIKKYRHELFLALLLTTLVIIDTLSWQHHFVFLMFPFIAAFFEIGKIRRKNVFYFLLACAYILVSRTIKNPQMFKIFPSSLILSHTFYGTCILFSILLYCVFKRNYEIR